MRIHLRLDSVSGAHIRQTVFIDGGNCGALCLRHGEYQMFVTALLLGAGGMAGHVTVEVDPIGWDKDGEFAMPGSPGCVRVEPTKVERVLGAIEESGELRR